MKLLKNIRWLFLISLQLTQCIELKKQLHYFGHDILTIINFNHPHYDNINFLKELYSPFFPNIIFYGPQGTDQVHCLDDHRGWYAYKGIADAMKCYPGYRGYLWFNDDCALFAWNLLQLDKNKIWSAPPGMGVAQNIWPGMYNLTMDPALAQWCWWQPNFDALKKVYNNLPAWACHNIEHDYGKNMVVWGNADALYIPQQYCKDFIELADVCAQENLFIEIALPLITACLEHKRNRLFMNVLWGLENNSIPEMHDDAEFLNFATQTCLWHESIHFCHPLKFSQARNQQFMRSFYKIVLHQQLQIPPTLPLYEPDIHVTR